MGGPHGTILLNPHSGDLEGTQYDARLRHPHRRADLTCRSLFMTAPLECADAFCRRFGLNAPIIQAPMAGACPPELAAAVASAGGMVRLTSMPNAQQWLRPARPSCLPRWASMRELAGSAGIIMIEGADNTARIREQS
jgi:hypothetical protein